MILIHTALQSEAQSFIEFYKLTLFKKNPKIYINDKIILTISGIGKGKTIKAIEVIFTEFKIKKAINVGIAGCNNKYIPIGTLFCTNKHLKNIKNLPLQTVNKIQLHNDSNDSLYDMEAKYFYDICLLHLEDKNILIFKVVSDYLDDKVPQREFVKKLIEQNIINIKQWI
jgi:nucleoside phosphorylase